MTKGQLCQISTPASRNLVDAGVEWCADNAVFAGKYPGDEAYLAWLARQPRIELCRFAAAPDVVGDAAATLARSAPMFARIRALGYPAALVAQDGLEHLDVPWDDFDALFLGGTTDWKLGPGARHLVLQAKSRGMWVHMGRVNSRRRLRYASQIGCDSVDGTLLAFGPDKHLEPLVRWLSQLEVRSA